MISTSHVNTLNADYNLSSLSKCHWNRYIMRYIDNKAPSPSFCNRGLWHWVPHSIASFFIVSNMSKFSLPLSTPRLQIELAYMFKATLKDLPHFTIHLAQSISIFLPQTYISCHTLCKTKHPSQHPHLQLYNFKICCLNRQHTSQHR